MHKLLLFIILFLGITAPSSCSAEEINTQLAGVDVTIYKTDSPPSGVTFFLTGSMIPLSEYKSTIDVLLEQNQLVVGFYINVFWPPLPNNHRIKANLVKKMFDDLRKKHPELVQHQEEYNIVGHSVGGQISLLVVAKYDTTRVNTIIALDPVDENPSFFTNENGNNESLMHSDSTTIYMTLTDGGAGISKDHNAQAIHDKNPGATELVRHQHAGHMAYTDHGGGPFGWLEKGGTPEGNKAAREGAHDLIRELIKD